MAVTRWTETGAQPKGLYVLFLTELWERFGFYTTVYLLVLFATQNLAMSDAEAGLLFGTFTAFIYATTVAGGLLADRLLGFRLAILLGAALMACGYGLMGIGSKPAVYAGLAALLVGNGFFKPNVSSLLGLLYERDDPRRDSGYTLFYMGINIGAGLAALGSGFVAQRFGYETAFLIAGFGKCLSFVTLAAGGRLLQGKGLPPNGKPLFRADFAGVPNLVWLSSGIAGAVIVANLLLRHTYVAGGTLATICLIFLAYFLFEVLRQDTKSRREAYTMLVLFLFGVVFWAVWNQSGDSVILFIERAVNRELFGRTVPPTSFVSLNSVFVILGAPLFSLLWPRLAKRNLAPSDAGKFVIGLLLIGTAYLLLRLPGDLEGLSVPVAPIWLVGFFCLFSFGELCVSPVGLSMVSRLASQHLLGFAMGMWFLVLAVGNYLSGLLSNLAVVPGGSSGAQERSIYQWAFLDYGLIAIGAGLTLFAMTPLIARLLAQREHPPE